MTLRDVDLGVCAGRVWEGDPARVAVVFPGALELSAASWYAPLVAVLHRGWTAVAYRDEFTDRSIEPAPWVRERAEAALRHAGSPSKTMVLSKSLGTFAAELAAERSLPAIWLTPLLTVPGVADALRARTAPALLVGGTADAMWDGAVARSISDDVLEFDGADHAFLDGDLDPRTYLATMIRIVERVDAFVDRID